MFRNKTLGFFHVYDDEGIVHRHDGGVVGTWCSFLGTWWRTQKPVTCLECLAKE